MDTLRERVKDAALDVGLGRRYGHTGNDTQDCVRFTYAILKAVYPNQPWSALNEVMHLNIPDGLGSFANVEAVIALGIGERVDHPMPSHWHYCQGWRSSNRGHCFLWWEPPVPILGSGWILEATNGTSDWYRPMDWTTVTKRYAELRCAALM